MKESLYITEIQCLDDISWNNFKNQLATDFILNIRLHPAYTIEPLNNLCEKQQIRINKAMLDIQKYADKRLRKLDKELGE